MESHSRRGRLHVFGVADDLNGRLRIGGRLDVPDNLVWQIGLGKRSTNSRRDRQFLVGDSLTLADLAVASPLVNYGHAGETLDAARWPSLAAWLARILARPSFAPMIERERRFLARLAG